jgi:hypothetical protein
MDNKNMELIGRGTGLPLDLVILINSFLSSSTRNSQMRISKKQSLCGFVMRRNANLDSVTSATGTPQESQICGVRLLIERILMKTSVVGMSEMSGI